MADATVTSERPRFIPLSTYRLQVHGGFPLTAARDVVPYLAALGHRRLLHLAVLHRGAGQHARLRRLRITTRSARSSAGPRRSADLRAALTQHHLGHVVDFVPNHMGIGNGRNARWNDVLENGPSSPASVFFDIEWAPETRGAPLEAAAADPRRSVRPRARARRVEVGFPRRPADADVFRYHAANQSAPGAARVRDAARAAHQHPRAGESRPPRVPEHRHARCRSCRRTPRSGPS